MECAYCGKGYTPRTQGRAQITCPGGVCYEALRAEARRTGAKRAATAKIARQPRTIERNESPGFQRIRRDLSRFGVDDLERLNH